MVDRFTVPLSQYFHGYGGPACYAIVPTSVMTDRTCIVSNRTDVVYSAYDPIACCKSCGYIPGKGAFADIPKKCGNTGKLTE